eukprot:GHVT01087323.1.p4 GENE.GHVT01087323.1~~GHVT01087323.1.p4  ORF type:complete len:115 (+),score=11.44 GHVT01087323.1:189-533(+)
MSSVRSAARRRDGGRDTNENGATHYDQSSRGERRGSLSAPIVPRKSRRNARDESDEKTTWVRYLTSRLGHDPMTSAGEKQLQSINAYIRAITTYGTVAGRLLLSARAAPQTCRL